MRTRARKESIKEPIQDPILSALKPESEPDNDELLKGANTTSESRRRRDVMKRYVSGKLSLTLAGITTAFMALAAIGMFLTS